MLNPQDLFENVYSFAGITTFHQYEGVRVANGESISFPNPAILVSHDGTYRARRGFSDEDDAHLANYLAIKVPERDEKGRGGNKLFRDLEGFLRKVVLRN